jgi:predicted aspartyl protease
MGAPRIGTAWPWLALALLLPFAASAQLYRWTDAEGRLHVTDDLSRVPPEHRPLAEQPRATDANWNQLGPAPDRAARTEAPPAGTAGGKRHVIPVERAGLELTVFATLNGRARARFTVDTGASVNTIPRRVVEELGIPIDESTPVTAVVGISGRPALVPVVTVDRVSLRNASVENVEMAVLDTMSYGLLGMPYFNHFKVAMDPSQGTLALEEIDLNSVEGVYGGYGERYWRSRFAMMRGMLEQIEAYREDVPSTHTGILEKLDAVEQYWQGQYDELEAKASRARVPRAWRD